MKALGRGSLAWFLWRALWVLRWLVIASAALFVAGAIAAIVEMTGLADLPKVEVLDRQPYVSRDLAVTASVLIVAFLAINRLRRIFATLSNGDPFVPENADHLRAIAIIIGVFEAFRMITDLALAIVVAANGLDGERAINVSINVLLWFAVLVILVLAEVFREGARLRDEQKLTV